MDRRLRALAVAGLIWATTPAQLHSQQTPQPQVRVPVVAVRLPVTVRDARGELALDLGPDDFRVYDNGVLQQIEHFDIGGDPLSVVLVAETSSRVEPLLDAVRRSGIIFAETIVGQNGEGAVIAFDDDVRVVEPFTTDHDRLEKAVRGLKAGGSGVRLYDALSSAIRLLEHRPANRRRAVVAVSESMDFGSEEKLGNVLREAQLANVAIYTVGLSTTAAQFRARPGQAGPPTLGPPGTFGRPGVPGVPQTPTTEAQLSPNVDIRALIAWLVQKGLNLVTPQALSVASEGTGGDHISTFRERSIEQAMDRIGGELHAQYTLAYELPSAGNYGYHEIRVEVTHPGYQVRTRPGYFLVPPSGGDAPQR
jgi:VWFA-related protein